MKRILLILALSMLGTTYSASSDAESDELVVVVNKANPSNKLDRDALRPMFQTTQTQWPSGTRAVPVNLPDDDAHRQRFDTVVLGLDPEHFARYWTDRKIRGGERPPRKVSSPSAVLRAVSEDVGGVGYVAAGEVNASVKVVARVRAGQVVAP